MFRDDKYLAFVRDNQCVSPQCLCPAEHAHHFSRRHGGGGVGCKVHDTFTVPLCAAHHDRVHTTGELPGLTSDETEFLFMRVALLLVTKWLVQGRSDLCKDELSQRVTFRSTWPWK